MKDLSKTIRWMQSDDWKERLIGEYWQTKLRYQGLHEMIVRYEAGKLNFTPNCSLETFKEQARCMGQYLYVLELRAVIEDINLDKFLKDE